MIQNLDWWAFLVLAPLVYWLIPARFRAGALSLASLGILFALSPYTVAFMVALALLVYGVLAISPAPATANGVPIGGLIPERLGPLRLSSWMFLIVLAYLLWYKYTPQLDEYIFKSNSFAKIAIPIGISYFSFKLMHYALEKGRGSLPPHSIQDFMSWMFLMPSFTSGPIERFDHFQITKETSFRIDFVVEGLTRIIQGLIKRFVFVEMLTGLAVQISGPDLNAFAYGTGGMSGAWAVWAYLFVALLILYLDFSAYTDMAIGASRLFGFNIIENFDYPIFASNIAEFWKRWHMSLTGWCRAYVYMPVIGLTRNPYTAIIATFVLVGLWHAGTIHWLAWGVWHGVGQAVALRWSRYAQMNRIRFFKTPLGKVTGWAMTMAYVCMGGTLVAFYGVGSFANSFLLMGRAFGYVHGPF